MHSWQCLFLIAQRRRALAYSAGDCVLNRGGAPLGTVGRVCLVPRTEVAPADERDATAGEIFVALLARAEAAAGSARFLETPGVLLGDGICEFSARKTRLSKGRLQKMLEWLADAISGGNFLWNVMLRDD